MCAPTSVVMVVYDPFLLVRGAIFNQERVLVHLREIEAFGRENFFYRAAGLAMKAQRVVEVGSPDLIDTMFRQACEHARSCDVTPGTDVTERVVCAAIARVLFGLSRHERNRRHG